MPFVPNTPESLLPRSDSKNPAVTCHGLTSTGRPCRRAITVTRTANATLLVDLKGMHGSEVYCWQHKDQVAFTTISPSPQGSQHIEIRERTSIETLVERLGLLDIGHGQEVEQKARRDKSESSTHVDSNSRPKLLKNTSNRRRSGAGAKQIQQSSLALFLCCGAVEEERLAARPVAVQHTKPSQIRVRRPTQQRQDARLPINQLKTPTSTSPLPSRQQGLHNRMSPLPKSPVPSQRPSLSAAPSSKTGQLLSLIPHTTSPQTSALLLAELAKPPSTFDEPGYIYIFWLTPDSLPSAPAHETASSLLFPAPSPSLSASHFRPPMNGRRTSSVLESFSVQSTSGSTSATTEIRATKASKTILLKIGRASNVQRRLNEWSRQCGYNLSLVRYYPYQSTSPLPSPSSETLRSPNVALKVPNVHKIERLIHLELAHKRAAAKSWNGELNPNQKCSRCGAAHREWFEVEASRDGVKSVDELVRRWVDWGLHNDRYDGSASL